MNVTEKQWSLIENIENTLYVKFEGSYRNEATQFITKHLDQYRKELEVQSNELSSAMETDFYSGG